MNFQEGISFPSYKILPENTSLLFLVRGLFHLVPPSATSYFIIIHNAYEVLKFTCTTRRAPALSLSPHLHVVIAKSSRKILKNNFRMPVLFQSPTLMWRTSNVVYLTVIIYTFPPCSYFINRYHLAFYRLLGCYLYYQSFWQNVK